MKNLNEQIKKKSFQRVYLLYGGEAYLRLQYKERLVEALLPDQNLMNLHVFEGKHTDIKELMAVADTMPFFSDYRVVIVENSGFFLTSAKDELVDYMKAIPEHTCLIFIEEEADKRNRLFKAVSSTGYATALTIPNDKQLVVWMASLVKKENKKIREQTLIYMLQLVEHDMNTIRNELEKVICFVGDREIIEKSDIDQVCHVFVENKIFDMIRAVAEKKQSMALSLYEDLVTLKEPAMRILYLMIKQFDTLYQIQTLSEEGYSSTSIADRTGIREFIVKRNMALCRYFTLEELRHAMQDGIEVEEAVKTGRMTDRLAVEWMLLKYSR